MSKIGNFVGLGYQPFGTIVDILQMNKTQRDMCLRELIITLLREVKDILSRENSVSTAYRVDRIFTGVHRGCMEGLGLTRALYKRPGLTSRENF